MFRVNDNSCRVNDEGAPKMFFIPLNNEQALTKRTYKTKEVLYNMLFDIIHILAVFVIWTKKNERIRS